MKKEKDVRRKSLIVIAIVLSLVIYAAGLLSGLGFSKFTEKRIGLRTEAELSVIKDYVSQLDFDLQSAQVGDMFVQSLNEKDHCNLSSIYFEQIKKNLNYFWSVLPARLESYEQSLEPSKDYTSLKKEYTLLSLRAWVIAKNNYEMCDSDIIPVLYFYSAGCTDCTRQGEELDELKAFLEEKGKSLIVFTVDYSQQEPSLEMIKEYYGIDSVPAMIINEQVLEGRLYNQNEVLMSLKKETLLDVFER